MGACALLLAAALFCIIDGWGAVSAERAHSPMEYHATVLNGRVVGSGFMIEDGLVVTNGHVARGMAPGQTAQLIASEGGETVSGRLLAVSPRMDLAIFAAPARFLREVGRSPTAPRDGMAVISAGVDAGGQAWPAPRMALSGQVIDAHANVPAYGPGLVARIPGVRPGFSGGPLLDRSGRLVGMVTAIRPGAGGGRMAASGFAPQRPAPAPASEAYVLRAAEIRAEVWRLLQRTSH